MPKKDNELTEAAASVVEVPILSGIDNLIQGAKDNIVYMKTQQMFSGLTRNDLAKNSRIAIMDSIRNGLVSCDMSEAEQHRYITSELEIIDRP